MITTSKFYDEEKNLFNISTVEYVLELVEKAMTYESTLIADELEERMLS